MCICPCWYVSMYVPLLICRCVFAHAGMYVYIFAYSLYLSVVGMIKCLSMPECALIVLPWEELCFQILYIREGMSLITRCWILILHTRNFLFLQVQDWMCRKIALWSIWKKWRWALHSMYETFYKNDTNNENRWNASIGALCWKARQREFANSYLVVFIYWYHFP